MIRDVLVQLSQVEMSLESATADNADIKDDLIQLKSDLQQLIQLTEGQTISHLYI